MKIDVMWVKRLVVLLMVLSFNSMMAQNDSIAEKGRVWKDLKYDVQSFLGAWGNSYTQPLRWKGDDFMTAAGFVGGTAILYLADREANDFFLRQTDDVPDIIQDFGWYFGSPQNFFIVSAGIYGFGLVFDNPKVRYTSILIVTAAASAGLIQSIAKTAVGRARPSSGDFDEFEPFSSESGFHSFPSGHAVLSFSMAHAIAKQFDNFWVKSGIYVLGSIAPISRLWADAHWISDVGFGMALSVVMVDGIDNYLRRKGRYGLAPKEKKINWSLQAGYGTLGVVGKF